MSLTDEDSCRRQLEVMNGAQQRYRDLKAIGYYTPGISDDCELNKVPGWFDPKRYEQCIYLARKYFVSLYVAHFIGLLMIIQIPSGLAPLLATGNSSSVAKLFRRYLSTLIHVRSWYESNPFDPELAAFKSIQKVRSMHKRVAHLMNNRSDKSPPSVTAAKDKLWLNQYDFVMTQWAFIGPVILYQSDCGLRPATRQEIEDICYLWRVIGYCMGIEDKYNLCSGNVDEDRELCRLLLDRDYRPVLHDDVFDGNNIGWQMGNGISLALQMLNPSLSFEAIINYWYPRMEIPHKMPLKTLFHKISYYYLLFNFQVALRFSIAHWFYGWVYRLLIALAVKKRHIKENILKIKYPELKYEQKCPVTNIDLNYTDAFNENLN